MDVKVDGEKIKELRLGKSWSQEKLADKACIGLRTIQRMEVDGTASLKSRLAVATALGVQPAELDPEERISNTEEKVRDAANASSGWEKLKTTFAYPGPSTVSSKIRTGILVTLWVLMMTTGGGILVLTIPLGYIAATDPDTPFLLVFIAQVPVLFIFLLTTGLYLFFKRILKSV